MLLAVDRPYSKSIIRISVQIIERDMSRLPGYLFKRRVGIIIFIYNILPALGLYFVFVGLGVFLSILLCFLYRLELYPGSLVGQPRDLLLPGVFCLLPCDRYAVAAYGC